MVFKKGKRKIEYEGAIYYWYVCVNNNGHRVHIISDDKKVHLEYPFIDTEIPVTPQVIRNYLKKIMVSSVDRINVWFCYASGYDMENRIISKGENRNLYRKYFS